MVLLTRLLTTPFTPLLLSHSMALSTMKGSITTPCSVSADEPLVVEYSTRRPVAWRLLKYSVSAKGWSLSVTDRETEIFLTLGVAVFSSRRLDAYQLQLNTKDIELFPSRS
jgi:hypothetical protein